MCALRSETNNGRLVIANAVDETAKYESVAMGNRFLARETGTQQRVWWRHQTKSNVELDTESRVLLLTHALLV